MLSCTSINESGSLELPLFGEVRHPLLNHFFINGKTANARSSLASNAHSLLAFDPSTPFRAASAAVGQGVAGGEEQRGEVAPVRKQDARHDAAAELAVRHVDEPDALADDAPYELARRPSPPAFVLAALRAPDLGRVDAAHAHVALRGDARPHPGLDLEGVTVDHSRHARGHALLEGRRAGRERKGQGGDSAYDESGPVAHFGSPRVPRVVSSCSNWVSQKGYRRNRDLRTGA